MRCVPRQRDTRGWQRRGCGIEQAGADADRQDAVTHGGCGRRVTIRAQALRPARDRHQQGGLCRLQRLRRYAEPGERAGADSLKVAAERSEGEPDVQHARPAIACFKLHGARHLDQLGADGARARLEQAGGLHGERGAAGDDVPRDEELNCRAEEGDRVDTRVVPEAPVLDRDEQFGHQRWCGIGTEAPDAAGGGEERQRAVVAVEDFGAGGREAGEVGRESVVEGGAEDGKCQTDRGEKAKPTTTRTRAPPPLAGGG